MILPCGAFSGRERVPACVLALFASLALFSCGAGEEGRARGGVEAPATQTENAVAQPVTVVATLEELQAAIRSYRGRAVLLNFWATWCEPCVRELPELVEVHEAFREKGGIVVGVSYDLMIPSKGAEVVLERVKQFASDRELGFDNYVFDDVDFDRINAWLALPGPIPATVAIDASGEVVDREEGAAGLERFEAMMRKALALQ